MAHFAAGARDKVVQSLQRDRSSRITCDISGFVDQRRPRLSKLIDGLALATAALYLDKKPISDAGEWLQRAMLLGPTVFPLAFAALGGRSMRNVALWNAERGTTIGVGLPSCNVLTQSHLTLGP